MTKEHAIKKLKAIYNNKLALTSGDIAGHLPLFQELTEKIKPQVVIHNGVRDGNSSCAFVIKVLEAGGKQIDIDLTENQDVDQVRIRKELNSDQWEHWVTDVKSIDVINKLQEYKGKVDIFFSDTSHNYQDTLFELIHYTPLLSDKGIMIIHDMDPWDQYPEQSRAIEEWMKDYPQWKAKVQKGCSGIGIFYRDEEHLHGIKCDSDVGNAYPWNNNLEEIEKDNKKCIQEGLLDDMRFWTNIKKIIK